MAILMLTLSKLIKKIKKNTLFSIDMINIKNIKEFILTLKFIVNKILYVIGSCLTITLIVCLHKFGLHKVLIILYIFLKMLILSKSSIVILCILILIYPFVVEKIYHTTYISTRFFTKKSYNVEFSLYASYYYYFLICLIFLLVKSIYFLLFTYFNPMYIIFILLVVYLLGIFFM
jgi:hypothetical protein